MNLSTISEEQNPLTDENVSASIESTTTNKTDIVQKIKTNLFRQERDRLWKITKQIRGAKDLNDFLNKTTVALQTELKADRAIVYRLDSENKGQVIAEALTSGWTPTLNKTISSNCFGGQTTANYQDRGYVAIENATNSQLTPYQKQLLAEFQVQGSLAVPILLDPYLPETNAHALTNIWGLLVVQQCSQPRQWQEDEINLLYQLSTELTRVVQPPIPRLQAGKQEDLVATIDLEMHRSMQRMLDEIRLAMEVDRVLIYGFNPDWSGEVLAESVDSQWMKAGSSFDRDYFVTTENHKPYYVVNNIDTQGVVPCLKESLEALQAKAYIAVSVKTGDRLIGILTAYQNSSSRDWQKSEIDRLIEYAAKFSYPLKQISSTRHLRFKAEKFEQFSQQDFLTSINKEAQEQIQNLLDKIRASMKLDRSVVFGFNPDWSGEVLAESYGSNWKPTGSVLDRDFHFKGGEFEPYYIANNVQNKGLARAVLEKFEQMQARAYIVVPIQANNQLLGVLGVYQNSSPRNWQESEVMQVREYANRFVKSLQQTSYWRNSQFQSKQIDATLKREKSLTKILEKVRLSKDEKAVLQIATNEGRKILDVDRVAVYRFNEDWSGNFIAESAASGWSNLTEIIPFIEDTFLQNTKGGRYKNGECFAVEDIYLAGHKECHVELLEQMEARAYVLAPIFLADSSMFGSKKLWGLIGSYQNTGARRWQPYEVDVVRQLGLQVGIALQQINYINKLEKQSQQEQASGKIIDKISKAENIDEIFKVATQEIRQSYQADRTVVYQFNEDWSGQVVAESVGSGWVSLLVEQTNDEMLSGNRTSSDRCVLRKWSVDDITDTDTYLKKTRGGKYAEEGKKFTAINDIYKQNFPDCYIASLEKYQARAYIIAPIFQDNELWGLLGVYQNSDTRNWEESETKQMVQIASQLAVAIQQANYVEKLKQQTEELEQTIQRERAAKEELQKQALDILKTVRPAFSGDLTVRANVTETEIGTVAGAYNTTLDSLKDIVVQVKEAVETVVDTTGASSAAMEGLSFKAQKQLEELELALEQIQATMETSVVTTKNAQKVESAIEQADSIVKNGDRAMNKTVESILGIRETVADAGKRVKRLSDSSQKISRVVNLISSFAAQTNLLALNAALEATRAGEYGKGFAVVADEVRNLSLQSSEATTEIEKLVREIQDETQEVASAMETGVKQVAQGTNLVTETRDSLNEIVSSTNEIRELVKDISQAANAQTKQAQSVTQVVGQVATIANETSEDSQRISGSFQELETLAQNLKSSVSRFKVK